MLRRSLLTSILVFSLIACDTPSGRSTVIATYRGGEITEAEFASWMDHKGKQDQAERREALIEIIAFTKFVSEQAITNGLDDDPRVRWTCKDYERKLLVGRLRRELGKQTVVPEEEVEAALQNNLENLVKQPKVRLRNIFKRLPEGAGASQRAAVQDNLESLRRELLEGADFAAMAEAESDSRTSISGGLIGWVESGDLSPSVEQVAFGMEPGQISEIIEGQGGFTILKCEKVQEGRTISEEEARQRLTDILRRRQAEAQWSQLRDELLTAAAPTIDRDVLTRENPDNDDVVAEFADRRLTAGELEFLLQSGRTPGWFDGSDFTAVVNQINDHIFRIQAAERARGLGYDREPSFANHIRWRTAEILVTAEVTRLAGLELKPLTEQEIRGYFEANPREFMVLPKLKLAAIMFDLDRDSRTQRYAQAEAALKSIKSGETSFEGAARLYSQHPSAVDGGQLGWLGTRRAAGFGPRVLRTLKQMQPGEISDLIQQDRALWIFWLQDRQEQRPLSFEEARGRTEQRLGNQRVQGLQQAIELRLVEQLDLEVS